MTELPEIPKTEDNRSYYTPIQRRILKMLSDGKPHTPAELISCLNDDMAKKGTVADHIMNIRKKLPEGQWIVCEIRFMKTYYRHVILLPQPTSSSQKDS